MESATESVQIHGRRLAFREAGRGEDRQAILLIHGMSVSSDTWRLLIPRLESEYHVIAPDLPGHGESALDYDDYSLGSMASALRDLLAQRGIRRCTVIGQSLGGGVALQFAYQFPEYCERICLIGSGGLGKDVNWILRFLSLPGAQLVLSGVARPGVYDLGEKLRRFARSKGIHADSHVESWSAFRALTRPGHRKAFFKTLRAVVDGGGQAVSARNRLYLCEQVPVQLIWGDSDPIIPVSHGYETHDAIPGSRLTVIPGVGHYPHFEASERVAEILRDFLETTEPGEIVVGGPGLSTPREE